MSEQSQDPGPATASSTTTQLYDSLPIPRNSQSIRVLDLPPKKSAPAQKLTGTLRIVDLNDSPKFTALSYVWGKSSGKSVICNGYDVKVTDCCFDALSSLQGTLGGLTIWVDAVCINQGDDDEKSTQIPLMEDIYTWAEAVYIWLGPRTEATRKGLEYIRLGSKYRMLPGGIPWKNKNTMMTVFQEQISIHKRMFTCLYLRYVKNQGLYFIALFTLMGIVYYSTSNSCLRRTTDLILIFNQLSVVLLPRFAQQRFILDWASLSVIMEQGWLQRSWTFQEIALASNPIIVFGQDHISWLEWHQGIAWVHDLRHKHRGYIDIPPDVISQQLKKWMSLCNVWQTLPRSCCWNGDRFRKVRDEAGHFKDKCSAQEYLQTPVPLRVRSYLYFFAHFPGEWLLWPFSMVNITHQTRGINGEPWIYRAEIPFFLSFFFFLPTILRSPLQEFCFIGLTHHSGQRNHLVGLVQAIRDRECSLKEDRVFAVGAILKRLGIHQPSPNYKKSTKEIYRDSFTGLIKWDPSFISLLVDSGSHLPDAPSWVPGWSTVAKRSWLSSSYIYDAIEAPRWSGKAMPISIVGNTLSVQAAFLHTATHYTVPFHRVEVKSAGSLMPRMEESLLHNIQSLCRWVLRVRRDVLVDSVYDSIPLGVLSVLKGNCTALNGMDTDARQVFNKVYTIMKRHSGQLKNQSETITGVVPATRATLKDMAAEKPCLDFLINACNELAGKRGLFLCNNGSIGSGPEDMLAGDLIALVKGVPVPMVLRRQGDGTRRDAYTVVGPSFIKGLMGLDAEGLEKRNLEWKQIDLV